MQFSNVLISIKGPALTSYLITIRKRSVALTIMICLGRDMIILLRATGTTGMTTAITIMATTEAIMDTQVFT